MSLLDLFILSFALAMDAFAVAICKGLAMKRARAKNALIIALYFGFFQAAMPLIGYFLGYSFRSYIVHVDHWIAFALLTVLGIRMIKESFDESCEADDSINYKIMFMLAIATSIDAFAVGITFAFLNVNIYLAIALIGLVTFLLSFLGVGLGNYFGYRYKKYAERFGGLVLIILGLRILIEHLFF